MNRLKKLLRQHPRFSIAGGVVLLAVLAVIIRTGNAPAANPTESPARSVVVTTPAELAGEASLSLIGTVRAFTEASITTERAGRITSVSATLGGNVQAGQVIATIENAAEQAAVLQAQGAYEAALANASVSEVSTAQAANQLEAAETAAKNAIQNTYTSVSNAYFTTIDKLYVNPTSPLTYPYFSNNNRSFLSNERIAFQDILPAWQQRAVTINNRAELDQLLRDSISYTERTRAIVDSFLQSLQNRDSETFNGTPVSSLIAEFSQVRNTLDGNIQALRSAETTIRNAEQALAQAEIASASDTVSISGAQVKQALGSLRAAQANLAKTLLRSPIAGTVNSLSVSVGDFVGSFEPIAIVANNDAFEIVTFAGDNELELLTAGDTVLIENEYEGIITTIAPAIDSATQKTEIRIATDNPNIKNGDTVRISKEAAAATSTPTRIQVPLSAVKFESTDGFIMFVEDGVLRQRGVTLGAIRGSTIEIVDGLSATDSFVLDVRGLTEGTAVTVVTR